MIDHQIQTPPAPPLPQPAPPSPRARRRSWRAAGFVVLCIACVSVPVGYVVHAGQRHDRQFNGAVVRPAAARLPVAAVVAGPHVMFRNMIYGEANHVAVAPLGATGDARAVTGLQCSRVHFADGNGLCLTDSRWEEDSRERLSGSGTGSARSSPSLCLRAPVGAMCSLWA